MELNEYTEERGVAARLARALNVPPVLISQWASGTRPVPEDRAPAIEFETEFKVPVETLCPNTRWERVPHPDWPNGKPLMDKTPLTRVTDSDDPAPSEDKPADKVSKMAVRDAA